MQLHASFGACDAIHRFPDIVGMAHVSADDSEDEKEYVPRKRTSGRVMRRTGLSDGSLDKTELELAGC